MRPGAGKGGGDRAARGPYAYSPRACRVCRAPRTVCGAHRACGAPQAGECATEGSHAVALAETSRGLYVDSVAVCARLVEQPGGDWTPQVGIGRWVAGRGSRHRGNRAASGSIYLSTYLPSTPPIAGGARALMVVWPRRGSKPLDDAKRAAGPQPRAAIAAPTLLRRTSAGVASRARVAREAADRTRRGDHLDVPARVHPKAPVGRRLVSPHGVLSPYSKSADLPFHDILHTCTRHERCCACKYN